MKLYRHETTRTYSRRIEIVNIYQSFKEAYRVWKNPKFHSSPPHGPIFFLLIVKPQLETTLCHLEQVEDVQVRERAKGRQDLREQAGDGGEGRCLRSLEGISKLSLSRS